MLTEIKLGCSEAMLDSLRCMGGAGTWECGKLQCMVSSSGIYRHRRDGKELQLKRGICSHQNVIFMGLRVLISMGKIIIWLKIVTSQPRFMLIGSCSFVDSRQQTTTNQNNNNMMWVRLAAAADNWFISLLNHWTTTGGTNWWWKVPPSVPALLHILHFSLEGESMWMGMVSEMMCDGRIFLTKM